MILNNGTITATQRPDFPWNIKHTNTRDNSKIWKLDRPIPINYEIPMDWHHIIPWKVLRDGWSALATSGRWDVLKEWVNLWGFDEVTIINNMRNGVLGSPDNANMWDKLCWAEWNIVEGPNNDLRIDDPGSDDVDTFNGFRMPSNLRDRSNILQLIYTQMKGWDKTKGNISEKEAKPLLQSFKKLNSYKKSPISMFNPEIWELVAEGRINRFGLADKHPTWRKRIP